MTRRPQGEKSRPALLGEDRRQLDLLTPAALQYARDRQDKAV